MTATTYKLKLKIGENEFEAEGDPDVVKEQFQAFKELVIDAARISPRAKGEPPASPPDGTGAAPRQESATQADVALDKIMRVEGRVVSLTVRAASLDDAILLIVYGQKAMRGNETVTGSEVMDGLTVSGLRVGRADRLLEKAGSSGDVIVIGTGRAKRYRISNAGMNKARQIAGTLIATVA